MPELPEVETYVRELEPELRGRTITGAAVTWPRTIAAPHADAFPAMATGQCFARFHRRGKYMLLGMESGDTLIVHLRMTGKLQVKPGDAEADRHTHVRFGLDDGRQLHFHDTRKFGRIWLVADTQPVLAKLGPEPFADEFSVAELGKRLAGRRAAVKGLLLDQSIVAGVGNIYADEALFLAQIAPQRPGGDLNEAELRAVRDSVRQVLGRAIELRGSSLGDSALQNYLRPGGEQGGFQLEHNVFRRTGEPCPVCGTPIRRIVIAQRSTHYCPHCQK
ncbi:MAG: bifunctional DNA-formamidopyrimidine glycosylase/DNA-(apurinic or apyrimidinic site) lyase [Caldilineaceae bacterium]|nr:bifunctional DNA-formamidopyrimidine glycosylase/DNA-(apurinic or apyrimidinic site) lyase [Caldilineaceae bacterium]